MRTKIPRPDLKKRFICTICEAGTCELIVENYDKAPTFCPFDKEFGEFKWEEIPEGAKNTEQQALELNVIRILEDYRLKPIA